MNVAFTMNKAYAASNVQHDINDSFYAGPLSGQYVVKISVFTEGRDEIGIVCVNWRSIMYRKDMWMREIA
ncbi:hypothetical protein ASE79_13390 [Sphingomonas sp. Leaf28]|nr:hypothetical protein ASE79_13390 [Sphingomonas sp. Leaf28]